MLEYFLEKHETEKKTSYCSKSLHIFLIVQSSVQRATTEVSVSESMGKGQTGTRGMLGEF